MFEAAEHLHRASALLERAKTAGAETWGQGTTESRHPLDRLAALCSCMDEAIASSSSRAAEDKVDRYVDVALRQYEKALEMRGLIDAQSEREVRCIRDLHAALVELERGAARGGSREERHEPLVAERLEAMERQIPTLETGAAAMLAEFQSISHELSESTAQNVSTQATIAGLEKAIHDEVIADAEAMSMLGVAGDIKKYRAEKERERLSAENQLQESQAKCKAQIKRLEFELLGYREKCRVELDELKSEHDALKTKFKESRVEVDSALARFAAEQSTKMAEHKSLEEADIRRMEEILRQRIFVLQSEVELNRQQLAKAVQGRQQREEEQLRDIKDAFRARHRLLHTRCERLVEHEHQVTSDLAVRKAKWEKQADRLRRGLGVVLTAKEMGL